MVKRKAAKKKKAAESAVKRKAGSPGKAYQGKVKEMPVPALALKVLAGILAVIMIIALTLYVLGRMSGRGFWTLAVLLAIIGFFVMPWMRKRFAGG